MARFKLGDRVSILSHINPSAANNIGRQGIVEHAFGANPAGEQWYRVLHHDPTWSEHCSALTRGGTMSECYREDWLTPA